MKVFLALLITCVLPLVACEIYSRRPIAIEGRHINQVLKSQEEAQREIDTFMSTPRRAIFTAAQQQSVIDFFHQSDINPNQVDYEDYEVAEFMSQRNLERLYDINYDTDGAPALIWKESGEMVASSDQHYSLVDDVLSDGPAASIPEIVSRVKAKHGIILRPIVKRW